ncbi:hypothetical protein EMGBS4_05330 [Acidimicrobiaceae bacterium]|nr:hypothetical protein EMGBS4_05330 [Acidimicrobiaceae bacterium]
MGQPVDVKQTAAGVAGRIRFELNRTLTGQGHERFTSAAQAIGPRPAAELARRLFTSGVVTGVHLFANIVTVDLAPGSRNGDLAQIVIDLHQYWKPGMKPPSVEELMAKVAPAVVEASSDSGSAPELSAAEKLIPPHLLARSRAARSKAQAN